MINSEEKILKIVGIFFISADFISSLTEEDEIATIDFYNENTWEEIKFSEANYTEQEIDSVDGTSYKQILSLILAGDDSTLQLAIKNLKTSKPVFRIEYDNGQFKLIGDKYNYCKLTNNFDSENFITKRQLTATRTSTTAAPFMA